MCRIKKEKVDWVLKDSNLKYKLSCTGVYIIHEGCLLMHVKSLRELTVFEHAWRIRGGFDGRN